MLKTFFVYISGAFSSLFYFKSELSNLSQNLISFKKVEKDNVILLEKLLENQTSQKNILDILEKKIDISFANLRLGKKKIETASTFVGTSVFTAYSPISIFICGLCVALVVVGVVSDFGHSSDMNSNIRELGTINKTLINNLINETLIPNHLSSQESLKLNTEIVLEQVKQLQKHQFTVYYDEQLKELNRSSLESVSCKGHSIKEIDI